MAINLLTNVNMHNNTIENAVLANAVAESMQISDTLYVTEGDDLQAIIDANDHVVLDCASLQTLSATGYTLTNKSIIIRSLYATTPAAYTFAASYFTITDSDIEFKDCDIGIIGVDCLTHSAPFITVTTTGVAVKQFTLTNSLLRLQNLVNNPNICLLDITNTILISRFSTLDASSSDDVFVNTINLVRIDAQLADSFNDRVGLHYSRLSIATNANTACTNATALYFKDTVNPIYVQFIYTTITCDSFVTSTGAIIIPNNKEIDYTICSQISDIVIAKEPEINFPEWLPNTPYTVGDKVKVTSGSDVYYIDCILNHTSGTTFFDGTEWTNWKYYYTLTVGQSYLTSMRSKSVSDHLQIHAVEDIHLGVVTIQSGFNCSIDDWWIKYNKTGYNTNGTVKGALDTLFTGKQNNLTRYNFDITAGTTQYDTEIDLLATGTCLVFLGVLLTQDTETTFKDYWIENNTIIHFRVAITNDSNLSILI